MPSNKDPSTQSTGLRARISALFQRSQPVTKSNTSVEMRSPGPSRPDLAGAFAAEAGRTRVIEFCRKIYKEDTRVKGIIHTLAGDSVNGGFTIKVQNNPRAQQSADDLIKRLKLASRLEDWTRLTLRDGDAFLENTVDADLQIVSVTHKPTLSMRRNSNAQDTFDDPTQAFWLAENSWDAVPPPNALFFAQWQIVHARWDHDEGSLYGTPLFATATKSYKRMDEGELDIAVRRKTRAGMKYLHVVEGADANALEDYKQKNKMALDNPFAAVADYFSNRPGSITTVQGDQNIGQIEDVLHHIRTFWLASPVPMSLLGYGQDLNRDVLDKQKEQYDESLPGVTQWVEDSIVIPILNLQWLLDGILPEGLTYEIEWKRKAVIHASDLTAIANAAMTLKALGFSDEAIISVLQRFMPGIDVRLALKAGGAPNQDGTQPSGIKANSANADQTAKAMDALPVTDKTA